MAGSARRCGKSRGVPVHAMHATSAGAGPAGSAVFLPTTCTVALPPVLAVPNERASVSMSHTVRVVCGEQTTERRNKKGKDRSFTDPRMALREQTVESGDRHVSRRYLWLLRLHWCGHWPASLCRSLAVLARWSLASRNTQHGGSTCTQYNSAVAWCIVSSAHHMRRPWTYAAAVHVLHGKKKIPTWPVAVAVNLK